MSIRGYLPSPQFSLIVVSFLLSSGLVFAADVVAHRNDTPASVAVASNDSTGGNESNWEAALYAIQAENASTSLSGPSAASVNQLLQAAQSANVTNTVGKTLFINLSNAKSQGLGDDAPTQDQLIAEAQAQIEAQGTTTLYTLADLNIIPDSPGALHTYGNAMVSIINNHPAANEQNAFNILANTVDSGDATQLKALVPIQTDYADIASDLLALPVPQTLAPLHLVVVNDFANMAASFDNMQAMLSDPLRGIVGVQTYQNSLTEASRMFTNIAQDLGKDGILFTKDEPGNAWAGFLSAQATAGSPQ